MRIRRTSREDEDRSGPRSIYENAARAPRGADDEPDAHRVERHFTMNVKTGAIQKRGIELPDEEIWIPLGELGPSTDYSRARGWVSLVERLWQRP